MRILTRLQGHCQVGVVVWVWECARHGARYIPECCLPLAWGREQVL